MRKYIQYIALGLLTVMTVLLLFQFSPSFCRISSAAAATIRKLPIYSVEREDNKLAISFDASWGATRTEQILDILDEYDIKATFFLVNIWLKDYPEMACEIASRGHEIGLHSVSHPQFTTLSQVQMKEELQGNFQMIKDITGCSPTLFRPPFGDYDNAVIEQVYSCGFIPIQWSIDSLDWKELSAYEICSRILPKMSAGDIILFHNDGLHTPEALPKILEEAKNKGLEICTISELLLEGETYTDATGRQKQSNNER